MTAIGYEQLFGCVSQTANAALGSKMELLVDIVINLLAHRIGVYVLGLLSGGRFKGESGFAWGWAVAVGGLVLFAPFVAIAWLLHTGGQ